MTKTNALPSEWLDAIRKRAEAATEGPWERLNITDVFTGTGKENNEGVRADSNDGWQVADCAEGLTSVGGRLVAMDVDEKKANAEFIAHAREDIPLLLAEIERLNEVNGRLHAVNKAIEKKWRNSKEEPKEYDELYGWY